MLIGQRDLGASVLLFGAFIGMLYAATGQPSYLVVGGLLTVGRGMGGLPRVRSRGPAGGGLADPVPGLRRRRLSGGAGLVRDGDRKPGRERARSRPPDLIPNAETDFIFAAVAEELGFAGSMAVLAAYAILVAVGFGIALRSRDRFRKLAAAGLTWVLGLQTFLIIGGVLRVVPLTGIALPFMSYGGSSLVGNFLLIGLLARISHEEQV